MADFQDGTTTKTAFRNLTEPIADPTTFNAIVQAVIVSNPFGCVSYMSAGETHAARGEDKRGLYREDRVPGHRRQSRREHLHRYVSLAGFNAGIAAILAAGSLNTAHGGTPGRDSDSETYSVTLKCHDPNGELYYLHFSRDPLIIASYTDDAIRTKIETWADTETALA